MSEVVRLKIDVSKIDKSKLFKGWMCGEVGVTAMGNLEILRRLVENVVKSCVDLDRTAKVANR